ncbi:hypothetical protein TcasGA2_TC006990 [Tribolium castaneum]|uniref:Protein TsetseEP domain-containing protein n=1 Tax=Tribolium castaneum TaxID=7070 RepID=D7EJZ0_TRICA|nr:PREDICTED: uncharacterized protein LOC103312985 [Tribolium castaneum]EFA12920.1 hypothetical protein TcasGA2_TC006990 [Tribolium castaneum]|eukprot:XP_008193221.1 PREDICTED: uncharacterized protein LOC103312985 [Tribolium castaneum]
MLKPSLVILVLTLLHLSQSSIIDEAKAKLNNLYSLVLGNIQIAENDFSQYYTDLNVYGHNIYDLGKIEIETIYGTVIKEIDQLEDLGHNANVDVSSCTKGQKDVINKFRELFENRVQVCINGKIQEAASLLKGSKYNVDVTMNSVHRLDHDVNVCGDSILCISPILTKINLATISLPQQIKTEVNNARDLLQDLKVMVAECRDNNVADFTSFVTSLVAIIANCVNKIIPKILM